MSTNFQAVYGRRSRPLPRAMGEYDGASLLPFAARRAATARAPSSERHNEGLAARPWNSNTASPLTIRNPPHDVYNSTKKGASGVTSLASVRRPRTLSGLRCSSPTLIFAVVVTPSGLWRAWLSNYPLGRCLRPDLESDRVPRQPRWHGLSRGAMKISGVQGPTCVQRPHLPHRGEAGGPPACRYHVWLRSHRSPERRSTGTRRSGLTAKENHACA